MKSNIIILLALCLSLPLVRATESYTINNQREYVFRNSEGKALMLHFCSENTVKVFFSFDGTFAQDSLSIAVDKQDFGEVSPYFTQQNACFELFTDKMRVVVDRESLKLDIFDKYQRLLLSDWGSGHSFGEDGIKAQKLMRKDEHFYGLGEKAGTLDRRGEVWRMWNSDKPCYCTTEDPLYKSIPFFMSSVGYGVFFDNTYKTVFDFGSNANSHYSFSSPGGSMKYYVFVGSDYKELISSYIALTGKAVMPPRWALGFSQCRGLYTREDLALEVGRTFREKQIPCDVIYQDIGWTEYLQNFEWRKGNYTNPVQMLSKLHDSGFRVVVSQDPVISQANQKQWAEADSLGLFTKDIRTGKTYEMPWPWGGNCGVVDFTNPFAAPWWGAYQQKAINDGVDGFWTDMGEPAWTNEESTDRLFQQHYLGMHDAVHNVYGLYWDKVVTEQFQAHNPGLRLFQMTRAAFSGMQRYTFSWTGDSGSPVAMTDSWEQFAAQIPMMLSAGMGGIPFITGDISGYCGSIEDYAKAAELYVRWMQFGLFTPLSRAHHEGDTAVEPWCFGPEAEACSRKAIELKYTLLPYIYSCAREAYDTGIPLMRAMLLEFPKDKHCTDLCDQFMFGSSLLVAPVVEEGARSRMVYLPAGWWYNYYTKELLKGGRSIEVDAPLDTTPLFVRAGSIIPTGDVEQYWGEKPRLPLYFDCYPSPNGDAEGSIYEDDGVTLNYKEDVCSRRSVTLSRSEDGSHRVKVSSRSDNNYSPKERNIVVRLYGLAAPKSVLLNKSKVKKVSFSKFNAFDLLPSPVRYEQGNVSAVAIQDTPQAYDITLSGAKK